jgi:DNA-directed RNA polymerase, subunit H (EC 2.7.7.6)
LDIAVFDSRLSPKYRVLPAQQVDELLARYNILKRDLPKIKLSDPAVKLLGASENDVLEIDRKSQTAGDYKYYRVVVK